MRVFIVACMKYMRRWKQESCRESRWQSGQIPSPGWFLYSLCFAQPGRWPGTLSAMNIFFYNYSSCAFLVVVYFGYFGICVSYVETVTKKTSQERGFVRFAGNIFLVNSSDLAVQMIFEP